jgi:hypothetical protein
MFMFLGRISTEIPKSRIYRLEKDTLADLSNI